MRAPETDGCSTDQQGHYLASCQPEVGNHCAHCPDHTSLPAPDRAIAAIHQKVSYQTTAANTKYTQQHAIDVEDVPGHILRVYEIHRTHPNNPPVINRVALKEQFTRGTSDQTDNNGVSINHSTYVLVNGDKFFTRGTTVAQNNGPGKSSNSSTAYIVGGTGKVGGIQGVTRGKAASEPKAGINENQTEIEYWFTK